MSHSGECVCPTRAGKGVFPARIETPEYSKMVAGFLGAQAPKQRYGGVMGHREEGNLKKQFLIEYFACKIFTRTVLPKGKSRPIALTKGFSSPLHNMPS